MAALRRYAVRIPVVGPIRIVEVPDRWFHEAAAELIGCKYAEPVYAVGLRLVDGILVVDEEGHPNQRDGNWRASYLYGAPSTPGGVPPIVGDALVATITVDGDGPDLTWLTFAEAQDIAQRLDRAFHARGADS